MENSFKGVVRKKTTRRGNNLQNGQKAQHSILDDVPACKTT
jgi:hypothetical protein